MAFELEALIRPNILRLKPYSSARAEFSGKAEVFLDANENPFPKPLALNRYPDPLQKQLKKEIAGIKKVRPEQIFLGNGSDEAIDLLFRIFCEPRVDNVLTMPPTYGMYQVSADIADVEVRKVSLIPELFQPDVDAVLERADARSKLLFVCSPNNPTGNTMEVEKVASLLRAFSGMVVVDEAYIDFSDQPSWLDRLEGFPNLVVLQTFSKAWGLAGMRLGMAFAAPSVIDWFNRVKAPYNLNALTQSKALEYIQDVEGSREQGSTILAERGRLWKQLEALPFIEKLYPSSANFILVKLPEAEKIYRYLMEAGVIVRNRSQVELCENTLRITIGSRSENERLMALLSAWGVKPAAEKV